MSRLICGPLLEVSVNSIVKRRLGAKVGSGVSVLVCELCFTYLSRTTTSDRWEFGWPSALLTCLLSVEKPTHGVHIWQIIPPSLQIFWQHLLRHSAFSNSPHCNFADVTVEVEIKRNKREIF